MYYFIKRPSGDMKIYHKEWEDKSIRVYNKRITDSEK